MAGRFSALRYRDFRLFWVGFVVAVSGQQMQWMIEGWLIYQLSGNPWLLGANGVAQLIPSTALTLFGGALADKFDQRKLLITVQLLFIVALGTLSGLGIAGMLTAWHVIAGGFILSAIGSFEGPARQAMFPHLVEREAMPSAVGLNAMIHPATRVGAPVAGGLLSEFFFETSGSASVAGGVVFAVTASAVAVYAALLWRVHLPAGGAYARTERAGRYGRCGGLYPAGEGVPVPDRHGVLEHGVRRGAGGAVPDIREGHPGRRAGGAGIHVGSDGQSGASRAYSSRRASRRPTSNGRC